MTDKRQHAGQNADQSKRPPVHVFGTLADLSLNPDAGHKPHVRTSELGPIELRADSPAAKTPRRIDEMSLSPVD